MARARSIHRCTDCGAEHPAWVGRCQGCGAWGTLVEERAASPAVPGPTASPGRAGRRRSPRSTPPSSSPAAPASPSSTACSAAGSCPARSRSLGGEPGIGKSTLLTQVAAAVAAAGDRSTCRPRSPASRCGSGPSASAPLRRRPVAGGRDRPRPTSSPTLDEVEPDAARRRLHPDRRRPRPSPSAPGSVTQVRACAHRLVREAKERGIAVVLVGHVTKDGALAGPRVLEHVVDTVLAFEGDRHHALRLLRAVKHRFGPTGELGVFEMGDAGLVGVPDAGALLPRRPPARARRLGRRAGHGGQPAAARRGAGPRRPATSIAQPRRSAAGRRPGRLAVVLAVLDAAGRRRAARRRRVRPRRRRRAGRRAGGRPRHGPRRRVVDGRTCRCRPTSWCAARSASAASSARSATRRGAWPRRPASASGGPSCPSSAPDGPAGHRRAAGVHARRGDRARRPRCRLDGARARRRRRALT